MRCVELGGAEAVGRLTSLLYVLFMGALRATVVIKVQFGLFCSNWNPFTFIVVVRSLEILRDLRKNHSKKRSPRVSLSSTMVMLD